MIIEMFIIACVRAGWGMTKHEIELPYGAGF